MDPSVEEILEQAERTAQAKAKSKARRMRAEDLNEDTRDPRRRGSSGNGFGGYGEPMEATTPRGYGEPMEAPAPRMGYGEPTEAPAPRKRAPPEPAPAPTSEDMKRSSSNNTNRYSIEREENDKRRSRRSHDLDDERRNSSDHGSANGSVRSRRRSRSPDRARARRDSRDRGDYRSRDYRDRDARDRPSSGDYYQGRGRGPTYDDDRYRPGRDGPPRRGYSPPRHDRDRHRGGGRPRSQDRRRPKTPEPTDDERDRRTVFVQQLAARLRTKDLKAFFEQVGPVVDAQIVKDRISQRSKGYVHLVLFPKTQADIHAVSAT